MSPFLISILILLPLDSPERSYEICPGLRLQNKASLDLSKNERELLCGDPNVNAWKSIPRNQRKLFVSRFLQQRGYQSPKYSNEPDNILTLIPGEKSRITSILITGIPTNLLRLHKRRNLIGAILTPKKLDELSSWIRSELQNQGYGCPHIDIKASPLGEIRVQIDSGPIHLLTEIERPSSDIYNFQILQRYEAFHIGEPIDNRLLTLSSLRVLKDDFFLSAYYDLRCSPSQSLRIRQQTILGKPRLITIGVGIDTEGLLKGQIRWKNLGLGKNANTLKAELDASFVQQSAEISADWFPLEASSRFHLLPRLKGTRFSEEKYEAISAEISAFASTNHDFSHFNLQASYGPSYEFVDTQKGNGPTNARFISFKGQLRLMSHSFEYYLSKPETGWDVIFNSYSRFQKLYSSSTFHRFSIDSIVLWNLGDFSPPYAVFGWRTSLGTFWFPNDGFQLSLPPQLRFFLGGDADVRGFSRKEIPNNGVGFRSFVYNGFELRTGDFFPYGIQPLIFLDMAWGGDGFFRLNGPTYSSPGAGIRWNTKIGVFRGTAAHGFIWGPQIKNVDSHWQFFLSYGQEF